MLVVQDADAAPVDVKMDFLVDASLCTSTITMCVTLWVPWPIVPALCVLCVKENYLYTLPPKQKLVC